MLIIAQSRLSIFLFIFSHYEKMSRAINEKVFQSILRQDNCIQKHSKKNKFSKRLIRFLEIYYHKYYF